MKCFTCNKKRISILLLGLIFFLGKIEAQELAKVQQLWQQKDLAGAREQVDLYVQANPNDAQGFLLKARIYNAISNDGALNASVADGRMESIHALQKAIKLNNASITDELRKDSFALPLQVYNGYSNDGIVAFNTATELNDKAMYAEALSTFKKASLVGTMIYNHKWGLQAIDTNNLFYSAKAAIKADKPEEAAAFIRKIADAGITQTYTNKGFESLYQWLVYYYRTQNNEAALNKYTALANVVYPKSEYYQLNYIDWLREQKKFDELYTNYQELFKRGFDKAEYKYAFLLDLFNYIYGGQESTSTINYRELLEKELTIYTRQNPAAVNGKLLFGKFYVNQAADVAKEMVMRKTEMDAKTLNAYNKLISGNIKLSNKYLQEIADKFPKTDRAVYNEALQLLVSNFTTLKQPALAKKYKAKIR